MSDNNGAGKGDSYRQVNIQKYNENFDKIFRKYQCQQVIQKSSVQNSKHIKVPARQV